MKYRIKFGNYSRKGPKGTKPQTFRKGDLIEPSPSELENLRDMLEPVVEIPTRTAPSKPKEEKPTTTPTRKENDKEGASSTTTTVTEEKKDGSGDPKGINDDLPEGVKNVGGGWYLLPGGTRVRGIEAVKKEMGKE